MNSKAKAIVAAGILLPGIAGAAVLFFFDPTRVPIYPVCVFHQWTGLDCPGCGSLRAMHALLHGRFIDALHFNLFLVLSLPLFAWWGFRMVSRQLKNQPMPPMRMGWVWLYVSLWIVFGVLRNLPVPLFAALAP